VHYFDQDPYGTIWDPNYVPFRASVVVVAFNGGCGLLEADIVETSEGRPTDVFNGVVRDQELLL
jgi:hypothetical protein